MSNSVVNNHRNSPAKKKTYADVANSSSSSRSSSNSPAHNAFHPSNHFLARLEFLLGNEMKFRGSAQPPSPSSNADNNVNNANNSNLNITSGMRDGSAHVLRCLKVWYDLPSEVFFWAVSSIDRFLTKMKAQPKHLSCIAVSAFHLACRHYKATADEDISVPDPADLVTISQSRCTPSDLLRMQAILVSKLDLQLDDTEEQQPVVTSLSLLRTMYDMCRTATASMGLRDLLSVSVQNKISLYDTKMVKKSCQR